MKFRLFRDLRIVTSTTSSTHWVSKFQLIVAYPSLFPKYKNYKNRRINAIVIYESRMASFFESQCISAKSTYCDCWLQKHRAAVFAVYGLIAVGNVIGIRPVLMMLTHTAVLFTVACITASPLYVWIISIVFLHSFNVSFTRALLVCEIFSRT